MTSLLERKLEGRLIKLFTTLSIPTKDKCDPFRIQKAHKEWGSEFPF